MGRYRIDLATPEMDAGLRRVAAVAMPGKIQLAFLREPSYLDANCVLGPDRATIAGWDRSSREVIGLATRSVRDVYFQGEPTRVGYLSALRIMPHARSIGLLARGFKFLKDLHDSDPRRPEFYLTTIAEGNDTAIRLLTSGRAGLPTYHFLGKLFTLAIPKRKQRRVADEFETTTATDADLDEVLGFLNAARSSRQFLPAYRQEDFVGEAPVFRDLESSHIRLIRREGELAGVVGIWNQQQFRQTVVQGYNGLFDRGRTLYNCWAKLTSRPLLPRPGERLAQCYAAIPLVKHDDQRVFRCLLDLLKQKESNDCDYVLLGLCDNDPLLRIARKHSVATYHTRIYAVSWTTLPDELRNPSRAPYYLELGCL